MSTEKKVKIRFLISPTGKYALAYNAGDEVEIGAAKAKEIVDNGDATYILDEAAVVKKTTKKTNKAENATDTAAAGAEQR